MSNLSLRKFSLLPKIRRHAYAAQWLHKALENPEGCYFDDYCKICPLLDLTPIPYDLEKVSERFHLHMKLAGLSPKEHEFLPFVKTQDHSSDIPFLPIWIYLDHLRLAQNVGSIIRTTEAFRLGSLYFAGNTPFIHQKKVQAAAMGAEKIVPCTQETPTLPRPWIGLETVPHSQQIHDYPFPPSFTLVLGNEEYGLSNHMLEECDHFVQIPLVGQKNSINVACAFAIAAAQIASSLRKPLILNQI